MRRQTLAGICVFIGLAVGLGLSFTTLTLPFGLSTLALSLLVIPILLLVMTPLNERLLARRGRNLDDEERHELKDADMISLRRTEKTEEDHIRYYDRRSR